MEHMIPIPLSLNTQRPPRNACHIFTTKYRFLYLEIILLCLALIGCNTEKGKNYTVGIIGVVPALEQSSLGFKEGMTALGYIEGKDIRYTYGSLTTDRSNLSSEALALVTSKVDLILSITTPATLAVKEATAGIGLPVVFSTVTDPVGAGIVDSIQHPGGNITGVSFGKQEALRLEWLIKIAPKIKRIYVPYNPQDKSPVLALKIARNTAAKLGVELITREVYDTATLIDATENIPADVDGVFLLPDSLIATRLMELTTITRRRKLPTSFPNINNVKNYSILCTFANDQEVDGKQAARLADQIFKGTKPADLPVELSEFRLVINLKVANAIGLTIPDEILRQADILVR